jgi:sodium/potassium-transporting ATPase subunit alpha
MDSITNMLPDECTVFRDGEQTNISGLDIVPGDVLLMKMGDKLVADVRFIEATADAKFDRSILTGETDPLRAAIDSTDDNYLETANIGMAGTHCTSGSARGVVVSTGDNTVFGQVRETPEAQVMQNSMAMGARLMAR